MCKFKRLMAAAMILVLLITTGCATMRGDPGPKQQLQAGPTITPEKPVSRPAHPPVPTLPTEPAETVPTVRQEPEETFPIPEPDRDSLEQIAQIVMPEDDTEDLTDEELTDLIMTEIEEEIGQEEVPDSGSPEIGPVEDSSDYDEDGAMTRPFDEIHPELVASEQVRYDDETLLLKLRGNAITDAMASAGVAAIECVVPMENAGWYEARLVEGTDIPAAVAALRALDEVLLVDYNYQVRTAGYADLSGNTRAGEQWYLNGYGISDGLEAMTVPGGSSSVIVAVIDTGVDYDHEDLAGNIWVNQGEIPDDGMDNDGNGYVDDYYGVDIVSGSSSGNDDNGHGTHVAGIIAARNNNLGTVGIAWNVQIMPIKAAMASGYLNQSDIARAIYYAYENGAEVINMSFGGTACSIAVQDALAIAYSRCVLVASAGNDGAPNQGLGAIPNYPAALSYVLGVMSVDQTGTESGFTNYDVAAFNGVEYELYAPGESILSTIPGDRYASWSGTSMAAPVVSAMAALLRSEYTDREMYPTKFIYGQLTATGGTLATCLDPVTHGPHNLPAIADLYSALTQLPRPDVGLSDQAIFDTEGLEHDTGVNNGDGVIDAGETIALGLTLKNRWGKADNTIVTIDTLSQAGLPDPYITILGNSMDYGSVGTYSDTDAGRIYTGDLLTGWEKPFYIQISPDCPNDYIFRLNVTITCENGLDAEDSNTYTTEGTVELAVRSGTILPSIISEDMVLTDDNLYIIPNGTVIQAGVTVDVEPGTSIQFWTDDPDDPYADSYMASLCVNGTLNLNGTREEPILIYPSDLMSQYAVQLYARDGGELNMTWTDVTNLVMYYNEGGEYCVADGYITSADHCTFRMNYACDAIRYRRLLDGEILDTNSWSGMMTIFDQATNCVFYKLSLHYPLTIRGNFDGCIFADCGLEFSEYDSSAKNCVFLGNRTINPAGDYAVTNSIMQIPAVGQLYEPDLESAGYYPEEDVRLYVSARNDAMTKELMAKLGYGTVTFESEEMVEWFLVYTWDVLGSYVDNFGEPEPAVGVTYDWLFAVPGREYSVEELNDLLLNAVEPPIVHPKFQGNAILNRISTDFDVNHWLRIEAPTSPGLEVPLGGNYWGTTDEQAIGLQLLDYTDLPAFYALLNYNPILTDAPENTFPFVTDVTILNRDGEEITTVSNEEITVRISFNRDMDTSVPLSVQYGSAYPCRDYTVEGEYVDARTWEGTKLLTTVIENGFQYFVISNGQSAEDDLMLCTDEARFFFKLDTTAAQALIMQGNPTEDGIELSWTQDDFDTLMGYNVYRSEAEDGYYQRINDTVIPAETKEFFDDTVEPGVLYYYNFTVVQTDLTESTPSGKIVIRALDTMAPNIYHTPVYTARTGVNLVISATVTDNLHLSHVKLHYRTTGESQWRTAVMNCINSKYTAIIPADQVTAAGIEYYIEAFDGVSHTYRGSEAAPYRIIVTEQVDVSSMGDVNGDGQITALDALMLLQAANDLLNLTAEQFERADLDGDGILTAAEALRILQYASGVIGSVVP